MTIHRTDSHSSDFKNLVKSLDATLLTIMEITMISLLSLTKLIPLKTVLLLTLMKFRQHVGLSKLSEDTVEIKECLPILSSEKED
jgi:hypothetical protein